MFKNEALQGRVLSVEDHMLTPEPSANLDLSNKQLSRCSHGSRESDVKSIQYLAITKGTNNQQVNSVCMARSKRDFPSLDSSSVEKLEFRHQHSSHNDSQLSSTDVQAYTYGRLPSVYEKLCIEIKFGEASHDLQTSSSLRTTGSEDLSLKPEKPKVMIFGDVMEPRKREDSMTAEYPTKENRLKMRTSSPTDSKAHSINSFSNSETASVYQKSKTLLRKASGLFTDKPPREGRNLMKSQSNMSLREAARSSNVKNPVLSRAGSVSKFVGSMKHRFHHILSKEKSTPGPSIDC